MPSGFFGGEGPRTGARQAAHCDHWGFDAGPEPVGRMVPQGWPFGPLQTETLSAFLDS